MLFRSSSRTRKARALTEPGSSRGWAARHTPALLHRNFRLLWIGLLLSFSGSMMQNAALLWHVSLLVSPDRKAIALGFVVAGVPGALVLGTATFFLSMIPVGPPLVWGGATLWLFYQGRPGWAIFMVVWGLLVISSVDNVVKPYLISRTASLPILLIALGVFGGALAFGFVGIFLGPVLLALALALLDRMSTKAA